MIDLYDEANQRQRAVGSESTLGVLLRLTARWKATARRHAANRIARGLCPHDLSTVSALDGQIRVRVRCDRCGEHDIWDPTDPASEARIFGQTGTELPAGYATGGPIPAGTAYQLGERGDCGIILPRLSSPPARTRRNSRREEDTHARCT